MKMKPPADMDGVRKESGTGLDPEDESALGFEHTLVSAAGHRSEHVVGRTRVCRGIPP